MNKLFTLVRHARIFAALSLGLLAGLTFAQSTGPSVLPGEDWTFPYTVAPHPFSGLFRDGNQVNPPLPPVVGEGILNHFSHHFTWITFNGTKGIFNFSALSDALNAAWDPVALKPRYLIIVRLEVGSYSGWDGQHIPSWVVSDHSLSPAHTFRTRGSAGSSDEIIYAAPWHPGVQTEFNNLIRELCKSTRTVNGYQYVAHPSLATIFLHGCSGSRGEESTVTGSGWTNAGGIDKATASATSVAGGNYPSLGAAIQDAWNDRVDFWKQALIDNGNGPLIRKITSVGGGRWENTSYDGTLFGNYVVTSGMGLRHGRIEHYFYGNGLPPKAGQSYLPYDSSGGYIVNTWSDALRDGRFWGDENEANLFENPITGVNLSENQEGGGEAGPVRDLAYRSPFFRAAQMGMNFLWAGPWQVRYGSYDNPTDSLATPTVQQMDQSFVSGRASLPRWFTLVAGHGPITSPDASCWLRQAVVTSIPGAPNPANWKNIERMLMQRDIASIGAVTAPAYPLNMPKIDLKPDANYSEDTARRTNYATGNRKIAFKLDPQFKASLAYPVQIKVTYRDTTSTLNNAWKVTVVKNGNVTQDLGDVPMTGPVGGFTSWKTATFTVDSASAFISAPTALGTDAQGDGVDFVIQVPSASADLTVRYVRVVRTSPPASGSSSGVYDANSLTISNSSGDGSATVSDAGASNGDFVRYDGNAVSDFVTFDLVVPAVGNYQIDARFNNNTTRGIYQLAIDDGAGFVSLGSAQDLYNPSFAFASINFGTRSLGAGTKKFRFTATGKNAASSSYKIGVDTITLIPVSVAPEATVTGNGVTIFNGDTTPETADLTDFGATDVATGTVQKDFSILNTGTAALTVSGAAATGDFGVLTAPPGSIAAGGNGTFTIAFNPTAAGLRAGTVSFNTNDANNDPFVFSVQGTGTAFAAIVNDANSLTISGSSGDVSATVTDALASNGNFVRYDGNAIGDFITFDVPVPASDTYQISARFNNNTTRGIYQLAVNNGSGFVDLGLPQDLYTETFTFASVDFGSVALTNGTRQFRFTAVGQNEFASAFKIGVDTITLTPLNGATEINVLGNGATIVDGDSTPSLTDYTDFGSADVATGNVTRTFTIQNTGTLAMSVGTVTLSGTNVADFSVTAQPATSAAAGDSTTFSVKFDPGATGLRTAALSFSNGDADENPYNFSIQGTGTGAPEINVQGNATNIVDGDTTPSLADHTDFGSADINGNTVSRTFTIQNTGGSALTVGTVTISGTHASNFTVTTQPPTSVAAGGSAPFVIQFDPSATGLRTASLSFSNNDPNENPYNFSIQGTGTAIAYRAASNANSGSANVNSLACNKPAGVASGDLMVAGIAIGSETAVVTAPAGWTLVRSMADDVRVNVYRKIADGSEPANYTWSISDPNSAAGRKLAIGIVALSGVNNATPIQSENGAPHTDLISAAHSTPAITTTGASTWLVTIFGDKNGTGSTWSSTSPAGFTERVDTRTTGSNATSIAIYTQGPVAAGSKQQTATASVSSNFAGMEIIALQP